MATTNSEIIKVENLKNFSDEKGLCHSYSLVLDELARIEELFDKK